MIKSPDKTCVHPHNIILELLTEIGIVGFCIFPILFGLIFEKAFLIFKQMSGDRPYDLFFLSSFIAVFFYLL